MTPALAHAVLGATALVLALLLPFAAHRTYLLRLASRRRSVERTPWEESSLPVVTVQLPVYNELPVVERLIDAACALDYPRDRLEIQVLDDSTDATVEVAARCVARWRARGVDVQHVRRPERTGYKAGALAHGAARARGDFFLVLDADFVAPPGLIRALLPPFRDDRVGMVQARWDHLNPDENWLTRGQSLLLDGHFLFEQGGRWAGERFFNFNGTAGMWRRSCIEDAGGWEHDTLTEDLDLSYRAQMAGWRFEYLDDVAVPAEIPSTVTALEVQQRRWAKGGVQTARKVLPRLLAGPWPLRVKAEAVVHLLGHVAHPLTLLLGLLLLPAELARQSLGIDRFLWLDLGVFGAATVPFLVFYAAAGARRGRPRRWLLRSVPQTLAVGIGLSAAVSRAVVSGLVGPRDTRFVRTPKKGGLPRSVYQPRRLRADLLAKLALGGVQLGYAAVALTAGFWGTLPFVVLFAAGYLGLGVGELRELRRARRSLPLLDRVHDEQRPHGEPQREPRPERLRPDTGLVVGLEAPVAEEYEPA
ncbi:MAG: glycosyltransferase [Gemmatimonadetes bacterium]|nr:MAG: glycosyltransferase [Gemmatimonadota bacterium]